MSQPKPESTREFLAAEAIAAERQAKFTCLFGAIALAVMGGYLAWITNSVAQVARPEVLADLAAGAAVSTIPEVSDELRTALVTAAPELAHTMIDALADGLPSMRQRLEYELTEISDEMVDASAKDVAERLERHLAKTGDGRPNVRMARATAAVIDELSREIEGQVDGPEDETANIFAALRDSHERLQGLNERLRRLARENNPDRNDAASRRLISAWMRFVELDGV